MGFSFGGSRSEQLVCGEGGAGQGQQCRKGCGEVEGVGVSLQTEQPAGEGAWLGMKASTMSTDGGERVHVLTWTVFPRQHSASEARLGWEPRLGADR